MIFFLKNIKWIYREIERLIGEDNYGGRGRGKKYGDTLIVLIGVLMTVGRLLYRKAREVVRVHLGIEISQTYTTV